MQLLRPWRWILVSVLLAVVLGLGGPTAAPSSVSQKAGRNYALLVACQEYDEKELKSLQFSRNDILEFHKVLLASGFDKDDIVLLHDKQEATKLRPLAKNIRTQLEVLLEGLRPQDTLVVAFAGHGVQFKGQKKHYFCPHDAELKDTATLVALDEVYKRLENCKAKRKLLLVDACRKDPQTKLARARQEVDLESVTRPQVDPVPEGVVALFSCSAGKEAFEHPALQHGIFFYHVLKGWRGAAANKDGEVTLTGLTDYVQMQTPKYARIKLNVAQVPQIKNEFSGIWLLHKAATAKATLAKHLELDLGGGVKLKVVRIDPGTFTMGSPKSEQDYIRKTFGAAGDWAAQEHPHEVEITKPYYMGVYTVTQAQYRQVMGKNPSWFSAQGNGKDKVAGMDTDDFPVEYVSWEEAKAFCEAVSALASVKGRELVVDLPTEAEWEYACRAGTKTAFHTGNSLSSKHTNFNGAFPYGGAAKGPYLGRPARVGSYAANAWGLYDMHGNVCQWCKDWYAKDYYLNGDKKDPQGTNDGEARVLRGGSWDGNARHCRSAIRYSTAPGDRNYGRGFRVVVRLSSRTP